MRKETFCLSEKMRDALASLKGKTLKSYEATLGGITGDISDLVVLHTGSVRVPVLRVDEEHELFGDTVLKAPLECFALEPGVPYRHTFSDESKLYLVSERVNAVELVRETASWTWDGEERALVEDQAIVLRMSGHALCLSISDEGSECIRVQLADPPESNEVVPPMGYRWSSDSGRLFERETISL